MQDQLVKIIVQTGDQSQLKLFERKAGQPVPKLAVQPGQRISVDIDGQVQGVSQAKAMNPGKDGRLKLVKNGKDLKVMTPDGEEELVQLTGYFETSDVVLAGDQWAWASDVPLQQSSAGVSALPDGVAVAGAAPVDGVSSAAQAAAEAQSAQSAAIVGVPPLLYILGAAGGLAVAAAGGGGGTPADTTPPAAPSETKFTANADGTLTVSGKAEAGSKVEVTMPDGSKVQATADANGNYSATSAKPQTSGTTTVTATDAAGNTSAPTSATYTDTTAPAAPTGTTLKPNADGTLTVSGKAEPGSKVEVTMPDGSKVQATADANGDYSATSAPSAKPQPSGTVTATATDAAGNTSAPASATYSDTTPPAAPTDTTLVASADGKLTVSGKAEPGSTVEVTMPDGSKVQATADANGNYSATSATSQTTGTVTVKATDAAGNTSAPASATFTDTVAPVFTSAAVSADGTQIVLTYSDTLDATNPPGIGAFSASVGGAIKSVTVSGNTVTLEMSDTITNNQTVTVTYTDPTTGNDTAAIQDKAGNDVSSLSGQGVTNGSTITPEKKAALAKIAAYAEDNGAVNPTPGAQDYTDAGVTGMGGTGEPSVAQINSVLASVPLVGNEADTTAKVQAIVDTYKAVLALADGTDQPGTTALTDAQLSNLGLDTLLNTADEKALFTDAVDNTTAGEVDSYTKLTDLVNAAKLAVAYTGAATGAGSTAPTAAQINALLGAPTVDASNATQVAAVQARLAEANSDGTPVTTIDELKRLVNGVLNPDDAKIEAIIKIAVYAETNTSAAPDATDYINAGIVNGANGLSTTAGDGKPTVAQINSVLASVPLVGNEANNTGKVQAIVDAYKTVLTLADGTDQAGTTALTNAQLSNLGVDTLLSTAEDKALFTDAVDNAVAGEVDSYTKLAELANAAKLAAAYTGTGTAPTAAQINDLLGANTIPADKEAAVQARLAAANSDGTPVTTIDELKRLVDGVVNPEAAQAAALAKIKAYADDATKPAPDATDYVNAQVGGIGAAGQPTVAQINTVLASLPLVGDEADSQPEVQAIVDAYQKVLTLANNNDDNGGTPAIALSAADVIALGLDKDATNPNGIDLGATSTTKDAALSLLTDAYDNADKGAGEVATHTQLAAIASLAAKVMAAADSADGNATGSEVGKDDLTALGVNTSGITADNLKAVQMAIARTADTGAAVDTVAKLQAVVTAAIAAYDASLAKLQAYAQDDGAAAASNPSLIPDASDYANIGVSGIDGAGQPTVAAMNSALAEPEVQAAQVPTAAAVQALVTAYSAITAAADGVADSDTNPTQTQYAAIGVNGVDNATKEGLLGSIIDRKEPTDVNTVAKVQALADAVKDVLALADNADNDGGTTATKLSPAITLDDAKLTALGLDTILPAAAVAEKTLFTDAVDNATAAEVDSYTKLAALANAAKLAAAYTGDAGTAPSAAQINTLLGAATVPADKEAAVQARLAQANSDGAPVTTIDELKRLVDGVIDPTNAKTVALARIAAYAQDNGGAPTNSPAPDATDYVNAGIVNAPNGLSTNNGTDGKPTVAQINSVLASVPLVGAEANEETEVRAIVDAYQAVLTLANNADDNGGTPTITLDDAKLTALGLETILPAAAVAEKTLFTDAVDNAVAAEVDSYTKLAELANAAKLAAAYTGTGTAPTAAQIDALLSGAATVAAGKEAAVQARLAEANSDGTPVTTIDELKRLVDGVNNADAAKAAALEKIKAYADDATKPAPDATDYVNAGIVNGANGLSTNNGADGKPTVAQINSVLASTPLVGTEADTTEKVQAIVDAYQKVLTLADDLDNGTISLSADDVNALGLDKAADGTTTLIDTADAETMALLTDAFDVANKGATPSEVATHADLAGIAAAVKRVMEVAAGNGTTPTTVTVADMLADLVKLGAISATNAATLTDGQKEAIHAALQAKADDGSATQTVASLIALVNAATGSLDTIKNYAETNSDMQPQLADFTNIAVTGIDGTDQPTVAQINSVLASAPLVGAEADSRTEVQAIVNAYQKVLTLANNTEDNGGTPAITLSADDVKALGLDTGDGNTNGINLNNGANQAAALALLTDAYDNASSGEVATYTELAAIASATAKVMAAADSGDGNATGNEVGKADLTALGLDTSGIDTDKIKAVQMAIAKTAEDGTGVNTLSKLQGVIDQALTDYTTALNKIKAYAADPNAATITDVNLIPDATDYEKLGISGLGGTNQATATIINTALAESEIDGSLAKAGSAAGVQKIVDAYNTILAAAAGGANDATTAPTLQNYLDIGLDASIILGGTGNVIDNSNTSATTDIGLSTAVAGRQDRLLSLLNSAIDRNTTDAGAIGIDNVDTVGELQNLATWAGKILAKAAQNATTSTTGATDIGKAEFEALGITNLTDGRTTKLRDFIWATNDDGSAVDRIDKIQALVDETAPTLNTAESTVTVDPNAVKHNANLVFTFAETVEFNAGTVTLTNNTDGGTVTITVDGNNFVGNTLTIDPNPSGDLLIGKEYTIDLGTTVRDLSKNVIAADNSAYTFTTIAGNTAPSFSNTSITSNSQLFPHVDSTTYGTVTTPANATEAPFAQAVTVPAGWNISYTNAGVNASSYRAYGGDYYGYTIMGTQYRIYGVEDSPMPGPTIMTTGADTTIATEVGKKYTVAVLWQLGQWRLSSDGSVVSTANGSSGSITLSAPGTSTFNKTFTATQAWNADSWQVAEITFTANSTSTTFIVTTTGSVVWDAITDSSYLTNSLPKVQTGVNVETLLPAANANDSGDAIAGYAVTSAASNANGAWEYQVQGAGNWTALSSASDAAAIVLKAGDKVRWSGTNTTHTALSLVAVDNSGDALGTTGSTVDASVKGGSSRFSDAVTLAAGTGPVLLDLNGDGHISTHQLLMDINTDGQLDLAHWVDAQDGVLVWDKHGNGQVTSDSQYTFSDFAGSTDMARLRAGFDSNGDGKLDAQDAKFAELRVWQDSNGNGVADAGELHTLAELGLQSMSLASDGVFATPQDGLTVFGQSSATLTNGASVAVFDAMLSYTDAWANAKVQPVL